MALHRNRQCCRVKDHSPLGLLGIILITAGVIIAIFDAKDTLPNTTEPYVVAIGIILIILGIISVVLAFMGYRRSRAMARQKVGLIHDGGRRRRNVRGEFETLTLPSKHNHQLSDYQEKRDNMCGPALIALPGCYKVILPSESEHYISRIDGHDNYAFQQSSGRVLSCESLNKHQLTWGTRTNSPPDPPEPGDQNQVHRIQVLEQGKEDGVVYYPRVTEWSRSDVAEYIPPVSTIV